MSVSLSLPCFVSSLSSSPSQSFFPTMSLPCVFCLHACLTCFLCPPLSLSYLCLLYLCLVPPPSLPSSCTCFTFVATSVPVSLLPPPPPPTSPIYLSCPCLILISIYVPVSLLSLSPSFSITVSVPFSPCLRLCLLSSSTSSVPISGPVSSSSLSSFPFLSHLRCPFWDGTSLGAGPRDWIGITRLSGRIELTSSHERRRACFPSLLRGRRWRGQGEGRDLTAGHDA